MTTSALLHRFICPTIALHLRALGVPASTDLKPYQLESLQTLCLYNVVVASSGNRSREAAALPRLPNLSNLHMDILHASPHSGRFSINLSEYGLEKVSLRALQHEIHLSMFSEMSSSLTHLTLAGKSWAVNQNNFASFLHRLSSDTILAYSFNGIQFSKITCPSRSWPPTSCLRSLELVDSGLAAFGQMSLPSLRKLLIRTTRLCRSENLTKLVTSAANSLEVLIVRSSMETPPPLQPACEIYSRDFTWALLECFRLKVFESVGAYCFTLKDWSVLCNRTFPQMQLLHIEQPPHNCTNLTDSSLVVIPFLRLEFWLTVKATV